MEDCCRRATVSFRGSCPGCGHAGREVDGITLKAMVRPEALARVGSDAHRFCPVPECPIVYFGSGEPFRREDVLVPVFQKEREGERTVCYCFAISEEQVRREVAVAGASASADRIRDLVKSGRCACEVRNPQGTCCLGNVAVVMSSVRPGKPPAERPVAR